MYRKEEVGRMKLAFRRRGFNDEQYCTHIKFCKQNTVVFCSRNFLCLFVIFADQVIIDPTLFFGIIRLRSFAVLVG